jgi:hypothetical protein
MFIEGLMVRRIGRMSGAKEPRVSQTLRTLSQQSVQMAS